MSLVSFIVQVSKPGTRSYRGWRSGLRALGLVVGIQLVAASPVAAQEGVVAGVVIGEGSLAPLGGAQVGVRGTALGTVTDANGRFRLTGVPGSDVTLDVRRIGYRPAQQGTRVGDTDVRITMQTKTVELNATVVTGQPGATEKRALGNAVSTIDAAAVTEIAPVNSVQDLLNGRAAGVAVMPATGAVGSGSRIRVRGSSSFSLSLEPLLYVDGVRVNNTNATGPENQSFGSASISRFNDLNPEDIESIEIIKGPAAATLYGTEASNGVVQVITKRGTTGAPRWSFTTKQGANYLRDPEGRFPTNWQLDNSGNPISIDIVELENQRGTPIFRNGRLQEYDLNVSGGSNVFRYFLAGGWEDSQGAERSNGLNRYNTRANLTVVPSTKMTVNGSLGYIKGNTDLSAEAGYGGRVWSTVLANPRYLTIENTERRGFHSGTPEQYDLLYNFNQGLDRFIGSIQFEHQPLSWLHHRLNVGTDRTQEENVIYYPRVDALVANPVFAEEALGLKEIRDRTVTYNTLDYAATATVNVSPALSSATSFGGQYYRKRNSYVYAYGEIFPAPGLSSVQATTSNRVNDEDVIEDATLGFYGQEQIGWRDRLFLTAGLRSDDASAFGRNFDRVYYPKVSASYVVSEEPFWRFGFVNTLKLRAAYGQSGKQPDTYAALRTYAPAVGPGGSAAVTPQFIGNPDLGPEKGKEIELGFDAGFLNDRLSLEFTYYDKRTDDAILEREVPPSVGFPGTTPGNENASGFQPFNAGRIKNTGIELLTHARAVEQPNVGLDLTFSVSTNDNKILSLGDPATRFVTAGTYLRHQVGYPVGSWFEKRVVSAQLDATGTAINVMCDDGNGGSVACTSAPVVYLGRTVPKVEGAFSSTLTLWQSLRLYGLLDFKTGQRKMDGNTRVRCTFFGGRCRENFFPQEFDPRRIAGIQSNRALVDFLIDDASFAKLRELSVAYTVPAQYTRMLGANHATVSLAGRNLATWTKYKGLEPEAMFLGGSRGGNHSAWEQTTLPQLSQWVTTINLTF